MLINKLSWGSVKSFAEEYTESFDNWSSNPRCRAIRIRNIGDDDVEIIQDNISEPIAAGDELIFGGYVNSFRDEAFTIKFAGVGVDPLIVIKQDIQRDDEFFTEHEGEYIISNCVE